MLTSDVDDPSGASDGREGGVHGGAVGDVEVFERDVAAGGAELVFRRSPGLLVNVEEDHLGAFSESHLDDGPTDAARSARDHSHLSFESRHISGYRTLGSLSRDTSRPTAHAHALSSSALPLLLGGRRSLPIDHDHIP